MVAKKNAAVAAKPPPAGTNGEQRLPRKHPSGAELTTELCNLEVQLRKRNADLEKAEAGLELAKGEVMFAATGVTTGDFLRGVRFYAKGCETHSIVMRSKSGTVRYITATHQLDKKPGFAP